MTGAKKEFVSTGIQLEGVDLVLTYDTTPMARPTAALPSLVDPASFGPLWRSSFHRKLVVIGSNGGALLSRGDGYVLVFAGGPTVFSATGNVAHRLTAVAGGFLFADVVTGDLEFFDTSGKLRTLTRADGTTMTFAYGAQGTLRSVLSSNGRIVRFGYSGGVIAQIVGPGSNQIEVSYTAAGSLSNLTWQDGKSVAFLYELADKPWALTGKVNEKGDRVGTYGYDAAGRAVSTVGAEGVEQHSVSYAVPPTLESSEYYDAAADLWIRSLTWKPASGAILTGPGGRTSAMAADVAGGMPVMVSSSQPAGSGCSSSTSYQTFDGAGNVLSRDDFNGNRTCFQYDTLHREIGRVEGLPSGASCAAALDAGAVLGAGARKIQTVWHPHWRLRETTSGALRRKTTVYQGRPDPFNGNATANCTAAANRSDGKPLPLVCGEVEQALTASGAVDSTTPARSNSFTYDARGRLISSVDPSGNTATYTYFTSSAFTGGGDGDSDIGGVVLLLYGDGPNGSRTIEDDSGFGRALQAVGDTQISTVQGKFGGSSISFDGAGDYISSAASPDFAFGSGDFTIEFWVWTNPTIPAWSRLMENEAYNVPGGWQFSYSGADASGSRRLGFQIGANGGAGARIDTNAALPTSQWVHLAVARSGGVIRMFVNGALQSGTITTAESFTSQKLRIGNLLTGGTGYLFSGYLDDVRFTKGRARYTASFTPPIAAFPSMGPTANAVGYTAGDLQSATSAAGHLMHFNLYDPAGRVRQMTDRKGVLTDIVYTPRGLVETVTVTWPGGTPRVTTYSYDDAGQLAGVSHPDGTTLTYSYDAAHRLKGVTDARGNSVTYTLDSAGNRTGEEVRDPGGVLRRNITRSFDALDRVQQVTGSKR